MAIQDGAMMSRETEDQKKERLARISEYMANTMTRGEQDEAEILQKILEEDEAKKKKQEM